MNEIDSDGRLRVAAGVLRDARGAILLTRRGDGRAFAGAWEFPGGKIERGETAAIALARELNEELGIAIAADRITPVIAVPCDHGGKRILLEVYEVPAWRGTARGREGQALAWTRPERLVDYAMPPADLPVVAALTRPACYVISPDPGDPDDDPDFVDFLDRFEQVLAAGARRVQLRAKRLDGDRLGLLAARCLACCREFEAELLINGCPPLARELGCGVHLTSAQLRTLADRPLEPDLPVAASCHDAEELAMAQTIGVDFAVLGPVRATASHPLAGPLGWDGFARIRETLALPVYALGGLGPGDLATARRHGAQGIAGISGFWPSAEATAAAHLGATARTP